MYNCIFSAHCTESTCDAACPALVETSYLLERNDINMNSFVFKREPKYLASAINTLDKCRGKAKVVTATNTVNTAELLTYCAICQNWKGSRLHCNVYNLKYSTYIESIKQSWTTRTEPEDLEYMRIWSQSAKVLIISNLDYVSFGDFESQTLLNLLQYRHNPDQTTIIVTPPVNSLVGKGMFFVKLQQMLGDMGVTRK